MNDTYPQIGSLSIDRIIFDKLIEARYSMKMSEILKIEGAKEEIEKMWQNARVKSPNSTS